MSEALTENGVPQDGSVPQDVNTTTATEDVALATILSGGIEDDSRVADVDTFTERTAEAQSLLSNLRRTAQSMRGQSQKVARAALDMASTVLRPNGFPDWSRSTDAMRKSWALVWGRAFNGVDDDLIRSTEQTVKKAIERMRPFYIAEHVLRTDPAFAELRKQSEQSDVDLQTILKSPPDALRAAVHAQYRGQIGKDGKQILNLPKDGPYRLVTTDGANNNAGGGGGPQDGPGSGQQTAQTIVRNAGTQAGNLDPFYGVQMALATLLAQVPKLKAPEIERRPAIVDMLAATNSVAYGLRKMVEGKQTEEDAEALDRLVAESSKLLDSLAQ